MDSKEQGSPHSRHIFENGREQFQIPPGHSVNSQVKVRILEGRSFLDLITWFVWRWKKFAAGFFALFNFFYQQTVICQRSHFWTAPFISKLSSLSRKGG